jgi:acyl carrier protein
LSDTDARAIVIEALDKTAGVSNDPAVLTRLRSPQGDITLEELGVDSLDLAEWALALEEMTGLVINPAELTGANHLSDVVKVIAAKLNARGQ